MTKNTKIALGVGAVALAYWIYTRNKAGKSLNPFANSSNYAGNDFFNVSGSQNLVWNHGLGKKYRIVKPAPNYMDFPNQYYKNLDELWRNPNTFKLNDGYLCDQVISGQIQTNLPCIPKQGKREGLRYGSEIIGHEVEHGTFFNPRWNTMLKQGVVKMSGHGMYFVPAQFLQEIK
jgi:hypothetical protein